MGFCFFCGFEGGFRVYSSDFSEAGVLPADSGFQSTLLVVLQVSVQRFPRVVL